MFSELDGCGFAAGWLRVRRWMVASSQLDGCGFAAGWLRVRSWMVASSQLDGFPFSRIFNFPGNEKIFPEIFLEVDYFCHFF